MIWLVIDRVSFAFKEMDLILKNLSGNGFCFHFLEEKYIQYFVWILCPLSEFPYFYVTSLLLLGHFLCGFHSFSVVGELYSFRNVVVFQEKLPGTNRRAFTFLNCIGI